MKDFKKKNAIGYNLKKRYYIYHRFEEWGATRLVGREFAGVGAGG